MNPQDYICKVEAESTFICNGCGVCVFDCDKCQSQGDYFRVDDFIACIPDGRHLCEPCFEDWLEEQDSELRNKQQLKQGELD